MKMKEARIQKGDAVMLQLNGIGECIAIVQDVTEYSIWLESQLPVDAMRGSFNKTGSNLKKAVFHAFPRNIANRINRLKVWRSSMENKFAVRVELQLLS